MRKFEDVIQQILIDLAEAQHASNIKSAELAQIYKSNTIPFLEFFNVPNSSIKSFNLNLKFGLEDFVALFSDKLQGYLNDLIHESWNDLLFQLSNDQMISDDEFMEMKNINPLISFDVINDSLNKVQWPVVIRQAIIDGFSGALKHQSSDKFQTIIDSITQQLDERIPLLLQQIIPANHLYGSDVSAVFDLNRLNNLGDNVICQINVNVDMDYLKWGFFTKTNEKGEPISVSSLIR